MKTEAPVPALTFDVIESDRKIQVHLKKKETKEVTKEFVKSMSDWNAWITVSFRGGKTSLSNAQERYSNFMKDECDTTTYFAAYELHTSGLGWHIHCLANIPQHRVDYYTVNKNDGKATYCRKLWARMFKEFGRTTISQIKNLDKVSDYCQKHVLDYTTKGDVRGLGVYDIHFGNAEAFRASPLSS
jgi:hypothetical protein